MRSMRSRIATVTVVGVVALAVLVVTTRPARADGGPFGLGIMLGSPTGLSMKYYLGHSGQAIDGGLGAAVASYGGFSIHADYLWHPVMLTRSSGFNMPLHIGVGARFLDHNRGRDYHDDDDDVHFGIRVPIGITFDFTKVPLDAFLEAAVIVDFISANDHHDAGMGVDLNAAIGVRYYF